MVKNRNRIQQQENTDRKHDRMFLIAFINMYMENQSEQRYGRIGCNRIERPVEPIKDPNGANTENGQHGREQIPYCSAFVSVHSVTLLYTHVGRS